MQCIQNFPLYKQCYSTIWFKGHMYREHVIWLLRLFHIMWLHLNFFQKKKCWEIEVFRVLYIYLFLISESSFRKSEYTWLHHFANITWIQESKICGKQPSANDRPEPAVFGQWFFWEPCAGSVFQKFNSHREKQSSNGRSSTGKHTPVCTYHRDCILCSPISLIGL